MPNDTGYTDIGSNYPVKIGDQIEASISQIMHVAFIKGSSWVILINNLTQGWKYSNIINYDLDQQTANFIVVAPQDLNGKISTLADFNAVAFDNCSVDIANSPEFATTDDGGFMYKILSTGYALPISVPSVPTGHNDGFIVTYSGTP
ncbi:hypothetical protein BACI71_60003 [Bacillus mycoides]|uniref:Uncharacterized protein n=2 Tax=Bacillus mycoides TaxID=1405 RepID=A0A654ANB2_BACMY|nr:hypothetical protein BACI71_60003 [Bacillus mycoides]